MLWPIGGGDALSRSYDDETGRLQRWLDPSHPRQIHAALRESYQLGADTIRMIAFDPMLPESMVDTEARRRLIDTACRFDDAAHVLWMRFLMNEAAPGNGARRRVQHRRADAIVVAPESRRQIALSIARPPRRCGRQWP